ncbi:MAG: hemolysin family protein [Planctomycetes bacterium]|jgi:putative hemolysin|nr:hemolysin family protein [Planctomycetota bacterium]
MFIYELIVIGAMLALNAIFAAYEMGLASISRARLAILLHDHKKGAADAVFMKDRMEASLAVVQVGITLVGAVAAATGGAGVQEQFSPALEQWGLSPTLADIVALVLLVVPLTFVTIVFAELVPKMIALHNNEWVVLRLSPVMKVLSRVAYPVVWITEATVKAIVDLLPRQTRAESGAKSQWLHELRAAVSLARTSKLLGEREEKIVLAAAQMSARPVGDIVIPAQDMSTIYVGSSLMEALIQAHMDMHTRFPVCMRPNDPQSVETYVNFKDIVAAMRVNPKDPSLKGISRPIRKVPETLPLSSLLETMIQQKTHIVLVVTADGTVLGMVTLEDVIEELVGEIEDEFDRLPVHIHPCGAAWIMGGGVPMTTVASTAGLNWSTKFGTGRVPSLAEWTRQNASDGLKGGEAIETDGLRVVPRKFRRKRLSEALVCPAGAQDSCAEGR